MSIVATLEANVARGAALLDEKVPDWFLRIEPAQVEIENCTTCVLGHLFGDYTEGLLELDIELQGGTHGFTSVHHADLHNTVDLQFEVLNTLWRDKIASRRCAWLVMQSEQKEVLTA